MKRVISAALLASAILLTATAAKAVPLFENPFPSTDWGIGPCSSCFGIGRAWDSFTLGADSKISQIDSDLLFIGDVSTINYSIWDPRLPTELLSKTFPPGVTMAHVPPGCTLHTPICFPDFLSGPRH